jgi:hypothetical protein
MKGIGTIILAFVIGAVLVLALSYSYVLRLQLYTYPADHDLIFQDLERKCYGYPELKKGRVWVCSDGQIEYDSSGVRFPTSFEKEKDDAQRTK